MAEIAQSGGGGGGKHGKKGRKHAGSPRVDMTPMVDLAFLLLTFFVLTSNLNKAKTLEMAVPKDDPTAPKMQLDDDLANTIILDGNADGTIYFYHGKLVADSTELYELKLDPSAKLNVRSTIADQNKGIQEKMKYVREVYKSGKFSAENNAKIKGFITESTAQGPKDPEAIVNLKKANFTECTTRLDADAKAGEMADSTYRKVSSVIRGSDSAPFFVVKWGGEATYGDVINIIDELKIGDASKYALTKVSCTELKALNGYQASKGQPVRYYKELQGKECMDEQAAAGGGAPPK
jgi:biopolymer transport protein ExbD